MVNFKNLSNLANKAKDAVEKRGGTEALKEDAERLRGIAKGPGSLADKAKAAAAALKDPEAGGEAKAGGEATAGSAEAPTSAPKKPAAKPKVKAAKAKQGGAKPKPADAAKPKL